MTDRQTQCYLEELCCKNSSNKNVKYKLKRKHKFPPEHVIQTRITTIAKIKNQNKDYFVQGRPRGVWWVKGDFTPPPPPNECRRPPQNF